MTTNRLRRLARSLIAPHLESPSTWVPMTEAEIAALSDRYRIERAVDNGSYPVDDFTLHCPFLAHLRGMPEFERIAAKARQRVEEFTA